jgi:hypothetical protein
MANTRYSNDECRVEKKLEMMTNPGRYIIDVPGNGTSYVEDPMIRIQKWGANFRTNAIDLESELKGILDPLGKDCRSRRTVTSSPISYSSCRELTTDQARTILPAWTIRDTVNQIDKSILFLDPQENCALRFQNNISTRILEKDYFYK